MTDAEKGADARVKDLRRERDEARTRIAMLESALADHQAGLRELHERFVQIADALPPYEQASVSERAVAEALPDPSDYARMGNAGRHGCLDAATSAAYRAGAEAAAAWMESECQFSQTGGCGTCKECRFAAAIRALPVPSPAPDGPAEGRSIDEGGIMTDLEIAAFRAGAEAMREAVIVEFGRNVDESSCYAVDVVELVTRIRALPVPSPAPVVAVVAEVGGRVFVPGAGWYVLTKRAADRESWRADRADVADRWRSLNYDQIALALAGRDGWRYEAPEKPGGTP